MAGCPQSRRARLEGGDGAQVELDDALERAKHRHDNQVEHLQVEKQEYGRGVDLGRRVHAHTRSIWRASNSAGLRMRAMQRRAMPGPLPWTTARRPTWVSLNMTMKEGRQRTMTSRKSPSAAVADVWTGCTNARGGWQKPKRLWAPERR